jgi:hypothetical protein
MSSLFDLRDDRGVRPYVRLDTLLESHGIEPAHVLGDPDSPMVVSIGAGRYVSSKDLARFLSWRAETALMQRMGRKIPPKPCFDRDAAPSDAVPDVYKLPVEKTLKIAPTKTDRRAARTPEPAIA